MKKQINTTNTTTNTTTNNEMKGSNNMIKIKTLKGLGQEYFDETIDILRQDENGEYTKELYIKDIEKQLNEDFEKGLEPYFTHSYKYFLYTNFEDIREELNKRFIENGNIEEDIEESISFVYEKYVIQFFEEMKEKIGNNKVEYTDITYDTKEFTYNENEVNKKIKELEEMIYD